LKGKKGIPLRNYFLWGITGEVTVGKIFDIEENGINLFALLGRT
jgi:hypothetical protein